MEIKVGQVWTFNHGQTYDVIVQITPNKIWYQIWQIKDLTYYDKKLNRNIIWSKAMPNNEGTIVDLECDTPDHLRKLIIKLKGKMLGYMNKDFGLNKEWRLVKIHKADKTKIWEPKL